MTLRPRPFAWILAALLCIAGSSASAQSFVTFESGQTRPLALSPDGSQLFAVNTPDGRLEIFDVDGTGLSHAGSVAVGLEPIAVAARTNSEVWVVNLLSDSVSVVDVGSTPPRVVRTLLVGDEPGDVVFAGPGGTRAFITAAHRGQNSPYTSATNPGALTTPGIGRADVWVFDATSLGSSLGGDPITIITLFGDTPRALAASSDGSRVYASVYRSGNRTTAVIEGAVCDGGAGAAPCTPSAGEQTAPGGLPAPNVDSDLVAQPEVGLIVRFDGTDWRDELNRSWNNMVRFDLPDLDVFEIDANAAPPVEIASAAGVGTVLYDLAVNPVSGRVYAANTEAVNEVRFEGERPGGDPTTTVQGHLHEARVTVVDFGASSVTPRHLNKHIDYSVRPAPPGVAVNSLAIPNGLAVSSDGTTLYVAAKGSGKVGIFDTTALENDSFVPSASDHVSISGGGPSGVVLDETHNRLYVLARFANEVAVVDLVSETEVASHSLHNPEPASVVAGRPFLYDALNTSSNGEAACGVCHVDADKDELAWDLGDPLGSVVNNPNPFAVGPVGDPDFHSMKGPMTTQTLRGMANHGPMHWRGDRTEGNDPGGDPLDEDAAFKKFNPAFVGLIGNDAQLSTGDMQAFTDFILQVTPPPNPIRNLDDTLTAAQAAGEFDYFNTPIDGGAITCNGCHVLDPAQGFFGADGQSSFEGETQHFKIPHLRNMYEKVGMFGMPQVAFFNPGDASHQGAQIRGYGFTHDGAVDTLFRFHNAVVFTFPGGDPQIRDMEQFMFAFDSNLKPIVGQQVTLTDTNAATVNGRINLLIARAAANDADVVVKGTDTGEARGWLLLPSGNFQPDRAADPLLSDAQLRQLATTSGQELTYTAVPVGSGTRAGVDRDEDGDLDGDDCGADDPTIHSGAAEDCNDGIDNDCDGLIDGDDPECGACVPDGQGQPCTSSTDCCSGVGNCTGGKKSNRVCEASSGGGEVCGDGVVEGSEECEAGVPLADTCTSLGFESGALACDEPSCQYDTSACVPFACGGNKAACSDNADCCSGNCRNGSCKGN
jgi:DNA-binding beta-propeller fold protein YncE